MDNTIKQYVCKCIGAPFDAADDFNYRKAGKVDSLGVVRLVLTLESRFGIVFTDNEIVSDEFSTIGGLVKIIEARAS